MRLWSSSYYKELMLGFYMVFYYVLNMSVMEGVCPVALMIYYTET